MKFSRTIKTTEYKGYKINKEVNSDGLLEFVVSKDSLVASRNNIYAGHESVILERIKQDIDKKIDKENN